MRAAVRAGRRRPGRVPRPRPGWVGCTRRWAPGRLDAYRASVVAEELEARPAAGARDRGRRAGGALRGRGRRRTCGGGAGGCWPGSAPTCCASAPPRARAECGLRRWADEPGVDQWEGTFPSEDAARAWAAIDALARRYVTDGVCAHIDRARAKALTDLVAGNATIDTVLTITVPAAGLLREADGHRDAGTSGSEVVAEGPGSDDLVEVTGPAGNQPVFVSRAWVTAMATPNARPGSRSRSTAKATSGPASAPGLGPGSQTVEVAPCDPDTGALIDPTTGQEPAYGQGSATVAHPDWATHPEAGTAPRTAQPLDAGPQASRSIGADVDIDIEAVEPSTATGRRGARGRESTPAGSDTPPGPVAVEPERAGRTAAPAGRAAREGASTLNRIAAGSGRARTGPRAGWPNGSRPATAGAASPAAPSPPGSATSTTSDPGPPAAPPTPTCSACAGATTASNNDPAGASRLAPDGTATWTDPTGRVRTTTPVDALTCTVLGGAATPPPAPVSTSITRTHLPDGPHSDLEFRLEHHAATIPAQLPSHHQLARRPRPTAPHRAAARSSNDPRRPTPSGGRTTTTSTSDTTHAPARRRTTRPPSEQAGTGPGPARPRAARGQPTAFTLVDAGLLRDWRRRRRQPPEPR